MFKIHDQSQKFGKPITTLAVNKGNKMTMYVLHKISNVHITIIKIYRGYFISISVRVWVKDPGATQLAGKPSLIFTLGR